MRWLRRRRCPHANLRGIYGDEINAVNARLQCRDCGRFLDGPVTLATPPEPNAQDSAERKTR